MSEMLWIAVPNGIKSGNAVLRVLVVPKLDGDTLSHHGMAQWPPSALRQGTVQVEVHRPGASAQAQPDLARAIAPTIPFQNGLWEALTNGLIVEDARTLRAESRGPLTVHATSNDAQTVSRTLQAVARARVTAALGSQSPDYVTRVRDALRDAHDVAASVHRPPPPAPPPPPAGFHRTLSMLREHPSVLRALGLIFEVRLDPAEVAPLAGGTVRVVWPGHTAPLPTVVSPRTRFGVEFLPGETENLAAGVVILDRLDAAGNRRWEVVTVDVDVATQRLREAARAMADRPDEPVTLPALRSGGLQLIFRGRGAEMQRRLARAAERRAAPPDVLTAEDLVLGYRIDVLPRLGGTTWFSLQQRNVTYRIHRRLSDAAISADFTIVGAAEMPEEGHLKSNAAIHDETGLHADEIVAGWRGWSLAAPRPSFEQPTPPAAPTLPEMAVSMSLAATSGSLPRLRFKNQYTLRARVADIAGGGLELTDPSPDNHRTLPVFYGRYEPILAPGIAVLDGVEATMLEPGDAIDHVVVRSDPTAGLDIVQYAARFGYRRHDQRLLLPPTTTQIIAEQHGMFDTAAPAQSWAWARRALEGALTDPAAGGITVAGIRPGAAAIPPLAWEGQWPDLRQRMLQLTAPLPGRPSVAWEGGWLIVRLAPAEQITLQLSSFPHEERFDRFAVHDAIPPGDSITAARQGRHPMLSPARTVTFVHAVQHPLPPASSVALVLSARQAAADTFADVAPNAAVFDPKSTAQLDVTASWIDQRDEVSARVDDQPVTTVTITSDSAPQPATLFRHEFGDTRHRMVTYTLRGVSRFRQYFRDTDPDAFAWTRTLAPVNVRSTSRPAPPVVLSARPAFEWEETGNLDAVGSVLTRKRLGTRVRLTLQPPWHTSGAGEMLAVVLRPATGGEAATGWASQAGSDPIYPSFGLAGGGPFARDITSGTGETRTLRIAEAGADAVIKPHAPVYLRDERCWVCDVALGAAFNRTLLQLAVARYQPNSLDGLWLSDVVRTDVVPLLPERTLRVTRQDGKFEVKLSGVVSTAKSVNRVDVVLERCERPAAVPLETVDLIGVGPATDGVPVWVKEQVLKARPGGITPLQWSATFFVRAGVTYRLRVREVEFIPNAADRTGASLKTATADEITERTVFTDIVPLPVL